MAFAEKVYSVIFPTDGRRAPATDHTAIAAAVAILATAIFLVDTMAQIGGSVAILYVIVVLLSANISLHGIFISAIFSLILAASAHFLKVNSNDASSSIVQITINSYTIIIAALISIDNKFYSEKILSQAELSDFSHDMIFTRGIDGLITFWNREAVECYGWTRLEAVGCKADDLLETRYPSDRSQIEEELLRTGRWEGMVRQRTKNGVEILAETRWALLLDETGLASGVLENHRDVTQLEASYAALRQSEQHYQRMFAASGAGLLRQDWKLVQDELQTIEQGGVADLTSYVTNNAGFIEQAKKLVRIVDVNPAMLAISGAQSIPSFLGYFTDALGKGNGTFAEAILAFARGDRFFQGETEMRTVDGRRVPIMFGLTFPDKESHDVEVLVFVVDLTERDKAQNAVLMAQADLARASRVATLGELTASIAHEVNQPLAAIVASGEAALRWLHRDTPNLDEVSSALTRSIAEGKRASAVVAHIRSFLAKGQVHREWLEPAGFIDDALLLVGHELMRTGVAVRTDVEADVPRVFADRIQLQQVLVNLVVNGAQAMAAVAGRRQLSLRAAKAPDGQLAITISDTGPGIDEEHLERLFEPFFTTKLEGMGMGLAICRSIVEAHGGRLTVDSRPGEGATFVVRLPTAAVLSNDPDRIL